MSIVALIHPPTFKASVWDPARIDYVQLSSEYAEHAAAARQRGWGVVETGLGHLAVVSDVEGVVAALDLSP